MADGKDFLGRIRPAILTNITDLAKYTAVKAGATQGEVTVCGANEQAIGVLAEELDAVSVKRQVDIIELVPGTVVPMISASAVGRVTSSLPTLVVPVAAGEVDDLPTGNGTYYVIGQVDIDSPATTTAAGGDILHVLVDPHKVVISSSSLQVIQAALTDTTSGKTSTVFYTFDLPTGISASVVAVRFSAVTVGEAGATIDVLAAGVTILAAPIAAAAGEVAGTVTDTSIADGQTITAAYTTGAASGSVVNGMLTILVRLVDAN